MKKIDELTQQYLDECRKEFNSDKMVDYFRKRLDFVVKLSNGLFVPFEKPTIQTRFCFGYSTLGQGPSYEEATESERNAYNEEYFMRVNLLDITKSIRMLKDKLTVIRYRKKYKGDGNICSLVWPSWYEDYEQYPVLSDEDRQLLIDSCYKQKEHFEKRLRTYLKRYGLSKIDTWTYWIDE